MHMFKGPNGTVFEELVDSVRIHGQAEVNNVDLAAFFDHVRETQRQLFTDRERIEFIRRAAIAFKASGYPDTEAEAEAWRAAESMWNSKPEGL